MRRTLWIILAVLFAAVGAPNAQADSYDATFTCTTPCQFSPSASVIPSGLGSSIVDVYYFGYFFPIWIQLAPGDTYTWFAESTTAFEPPDRIVSFDIYDRNKGTDWYIIYLAPLDLPDNTERGTLVFTPIATPEPRSLVLVLVGIGLLLVLRNRLG